MAHNKVFGICENKCLVEIEQKKINFQDNRNFYTTIDAGKSGHYAYWANLDAIQESDTDYSYNFGLGLSDSNKNVKKCVEFEIDIFDYKTGSRPYYERLEPTDMIKNILASKKYVITGDDLSNRSYSWSVPLNTTVSGERIDLNPISRQALIKINVYTE